MILSRYKIKNIVSESVVVPDESIFELPEKVLQFGTGVFLRGLPDFVIDKANRMGLFNGRIVVVKSTGKGDTAAFDKQDGLYTVCVRGVQNGATITENIVNASISRVLTATEEWEQILECAHSRSMQVIISNTTEVGIQLVNEDVRHHPPVSFPGKMLAFLYERFKAFNGSAHSGMVIIPTELVPNNGKLLESIVLELAHLNGLEDEFIEWLEKYNHFCNSLVDRMVPGKPDAKTAAEIEEELGCSDQLMIVAEEYYLWAIEGSDQVKSVLSFAEADENIIIAPDIELYRELKLRLLNGTHTLTCGLALLSGFETVNEAAEDETFTTLLSELLFQELAPSIPFPVDPAAAHCFGARVLDRFRNPYIQFKWTKIALQFSTKMKMRCIPLLLQYYKNNETVPALFTLCFAGYLKFLKGIRKKGNQFFGVLNGKEFLLEDDMAGFFYKHGQTLPTEMFVAKVLGNQALWNENLNELPGFYQAVLLQLQALEDIEIKKVVGTLLSKNELA